MEIDVTWEDLLTLAANGHIDKDGITIKIGWPVTPDAHHSPHNSPDGSKSFVRFTIDDADLHPKQLVLRRTKMTTRPAIFKWR